MRILFYQKRCFLFKTVIGIVFQRLYLIYSRMNIKKYCLSLLRTKKRKTYEKGIYFYSFLVRVGRFDSG